MSDHMGFYRKNIEESKVFYIKILKPLGHELSIESDLFCAFGPDYVFYIGKSDKAGAGHVILKARSRAEVDEMINICQLCEERSTISLPRKGINVDQLFSLCQDSHTSLVPV
ncbi:uncharacterized protein VTP21DRAFT_10732 [Calcarisporiella thermophila]|uniref:uncharacterized protein n=1 Tax=Calcarisporiella thermophila TaxID=911321 RepID=UPI003741FB48